jgi:hypothetical protein
VRISQIRVERLGVARSNRATLVGVGLDVVEGFRYSFVVPPNERQRVLVALSHGQQPVIHVPDYNIVAARSVGPIDWGVTS